MLALLELVDAALFREAECWFAGGAAVALRCGEFRISRDVDFLCASREGYRLLRERVYHKGARALFSREVTVRREARVDRYGIRTAIEVEGEPIKFEVVSEGRIDLTGEVDPTLPVARLTDADLVAEKLLANEDRYLDDSALGRDAIDLLVLERTLGSLPESAWAKARAAYGPSVHNAWGRALRRLRDRPEMLARGFDTMAVLPAVREVIEARLATIADLDEA